MEEQNHSQELVDSKDNDIDQIFQEQKGGPDLAGASDHHTDTREEWRDTLQDAWQQSCGDMEVLAQLTQSDSDEVFTNEVPGGLGSDAAQVMHDGSSQLNNKLEHINDDKQEEEGSSLQHTSAAYIQKLSDSEPHPGQGGSSSDQNSDGVVQHSDSDSLRGSVSSVSSHSSTLDKDASSATEDGHKAIKFALTHWPRSSSRSESVQRVKVRAMPIARTMSTDAGIQNSYVASMERHIKDLKSNYPHVIFFRYVKFVNGGTCYTFVWCTVLQ